MSSRSKKRSVTHHLCLCCGLDDCPDRWPPLAEGNGCIAVLLDQIAFPRLLDDSAWAPLNWCREGCVLSCPRCRQIAAGNEPAYVTPVPTVRQVMRHLRKVRGVPAAVIAEAYGCHADTVRCWVQADATAQAPAAPRVPKRTA